MRLTHKLFLGACAPLVLSSLALAHHVPVPLSYGEAEQVLTRVVWERSAPQAGIPAYLAAADEHPASYALVDGASFFVADGAGQVETIVFHAADFADIGHANIDEVVAAIAGQSALVRGLHANGWLVLEGRAGGAGARLSLRDGPQGALARLDLAPGVRLGSDGLRLALSPGVHDAHADDHEPGHFAHRRYVVLASATEGTTRRAGVEIPLVLDGVTRDALRLTGAGALPGFAGELDENEDGEAVAPLALLDALLGPTPPPALHFALLVLSEDGSSIDFVSNRFTLEIR